MSTEERSRVVFGKTTTGFAELEVFSGRWERGYLDGAGGVFAGMVIFWCFSGDGHYPWYESED